MTNRNILISGASIAGPAAAYWLRKAGYNVTIVERAPGIRPGGQAVDLRGAGRTVIERMGLMDACKAVSLHQHGMRWINAEGKIKATMREDAFGGEGIISEIEILRGDLADVLYEATRHDVEYLFDDSITGIQQHPGHVLVTFENAAPREFALVIGADGLHSAVRRHAFGPESDYVKPMDCFMSYFTVKEDLGLDAWYYMHNAPGGLVASARPGRVPGEFKGSLAFRADAFEYDRRDMGAQREMLAAKFADVGWKARQLVEAARIAPDFFFDNIGQVHMEHWTNGRAALVGDAGYCPSPLTGLGTSLALVGAYVLAGELGRANGDHRAAFARYEEIMRPYVKTCQELPPGGTSGFAPKKAFMIRLGNFSMRLMTRKPLSTLLAPVFTKAKSIDLPDY